MVAAKPRATRIRRRTLADEVHEEIRRAIIEDELAGDERLTIDALAEQLGVSATPVREALARLASEGLASYEPLVGYRVEPPLDAEALDRLMEARGLLEPRVAKLAAERRTEEDLAGLDLQVLVAEGADEARDHVALDAAFHTWVATCARNPFLLAALTDLRAHVQIYRLGVAPVTVSHTVAEHRAVHEAIVAGDGPASSAAMAAHLERTHRRHEGDQH
jgi:DNA-binding GntR family transcriptional regulator